MLKALVWRLKTRIQSTEKSQGQKIIVMSQKELNRAIMLSSESTSQNETHEVVVVGFHGTGE